MRRSLFGLVAGLALGAPYPASAESCDSLIERVSSATGIEAGEREQDGEHAFVSYSADPDIIVTLACAPGSPASIGVRHRGEEPPDAYFRLFGRAGQVVTRVDAERIVAAAQRAWAYAPRLRHSHAVADEALITCSLSRSGAGDAMTMCVVMVRSEQG